MSERAQSQSSPRLDAPPGGTLQQFHELFARVTPTIDQPATRAQGTEPPPLAEAALPGGAASDGSSGGRALAAHFAALFGPPASAEGVPQPLAEAATERMEAPVHAPVGAPMHAPIGAPGHASQDARRASQPASEPRAPLQERKRRVELALPDVEANVQTWTLIGPAGAGKTSLVAAFDAACFARDDGDGELSIAWTRDGGHVDRLQQAGQRWIARDVAPASTAQATAYSFELTVERPRRWFRPSTPVVRQLRCSEEPGQAMFPASEDPAEPVAPHRIGELSRATSLVIAVDATRLCAATIEASLPSLLDRISSSRPGERGWRSTSRWLPGALGRRGPSTIRRTRLVARRVLILLTKIDLLADCLAQRSRDLGAPLSVAEAARALDPIALAFQVLGPRCVRRLYHALGRDADLAIGTSSACGFSPDGARTFHRWADGRSTQERVQAWEPFGVREALRFLATGHLGATLHRVDASELEATTSLPFLFSSQGVTP